MKEMFRPIGVMLLAGLLLASGQNGALPSANTHAESHAGDSYVLLLKKHNTEAISRGPDFSQSASALKYGKRKQLRDFVWFSTNAGCFVAADPESIRNLTELENAQKELNRQWARLRRDPASVRELRQRQNQHAMRRDEFVWALFDELKNEGRLANTKLNCAPH